MEETQATPETTQVQPSANDHVSVKDGVVILSPEAEAIMEGKEPEIKEQEKTEPEKASDPEPEKKEPPKEEKPKRKIKWQGEEVEIEPDKEEELLQKGFDYTKKTQALAAERDLITPHVGLIKAMQADPDLQKHIANYLKGDTKKEAPKEFDDPIDQLKYETRQEVLKEVEEKFFKPLQQKTENVSREQVINSVLAQVQKDDLYPEVDKAMREYIAELPEVVGRPLFNQLNNDPKSYLETYNKLRKKIADKKQKEPEKKQAAESAETDKMPEPVKRETKAPLLESADKGGAEPSSKALNDKIKVLIKRSRNGDHTATGELLELSALK